MREKSSPRLWLFAKARRDEKNRKVCLMKLDGESPSGKALGFGPSIRGFESLLPSQTRMLICQWQLGVFVCRRGGFERECPVDIRRP